MNKQNPEASQMISLMNVVLQEKDKKDSRKRDLKFKDKKVKKGSNSSTQSSSPSGSIVD